MKSVIRNKNRLAEIIEEEYNPSEKEGEDSPETTSLLKLLRRKKEQEAEKLEAKGSKRASQNFSK